MGLFDKNVLNSGNQVKDSLSPPEAVAAITLAAIASDGYMSEEEVNSICVILPRMKLFQSYTKDKIMGMIEKLLNFLQQEGIDALFNAAQASLPENLRESAFALATDMVLADGVVTKEEQGFLNDLYHSLGIANDVANQIVQVMLIKNRG
ncbi:tellurite resistance TerB family protein [Calothrix rhizosoleniae]|uniref:tellurite resistance TerB family protein n=1 Tax=Calothrix rhizosoleniae TaxID=888997 RepID=UPI000B49A61B|nr:tellurite resistance TerB family protein [Calothrix rhizosoleniae]